VVYGVSQGAYSAAISMASIVGSLVIQFSGLPGTFVFSTVIFVGAALWSVQAASPSRLRPI
jgi:hypothetical protein